MIHSARFASPAIGDHYFHLENSYVLQDFEKSKQAEVQTADLCENSCRYRPGLWIGLVDEKGFLILLI